LDWEQCLDLEVFIFLSFRILFAWHAHRSLSKFCFSVQFSSYKNADMS
jgi:hypothetical protein